MNVSMEIPDDLALRLGATGAELSRRALEAFALDEYRRGQLTETELQRVLGFGTRYQLDGFFKAHDIWIDDVTPDELQADVEALRRLGV